MHSFVVSCLGTDIKHKWTSASQYIPVQLQFYGIFLRILYTWTRQCKGVHWFIHKEVQNWHISVHTAINTVLCLYILVRTDMYWYVCESVLLQIGECSQASGGPPWKQSWYIPYQYILVQTGTSMWHTGTYFVEPVYLGRQAWRLPWRRTLRARNKSSV